MTLSHTSKEKHHGRFVRTYQTRASALYGQIGCVVFPTPHDESVTAENHQNIQTTALDWEVGLRARAKVKGKVKGKGQGQRSRSKDKGEGQGQRTRTRSKVKVKDKG